MLKDFGVSGTRSLSSARLISERPDTGFERQHETIEEAFGADVRHCAPPFR